MIEQECRKLIEKARGNGEFPNYSWISRHGKLSESFMREYWDELDLGFIAEFQKLSEDFMREMKEKQDWLSLSQCQKMSTKFLKEFKDKIRWNARKHFVSVPKEIYQKYGEYFIE